MSNKISVGNIRHRIILQLFFVTKRWDDNIAIVNLVYAANRVFADLGLEDVWVRRRGNRAFLFSETNHRIVCEVGLDNERNVWLVNLRGLIPDRQPLNILIDDVAKLGMRRERKIYEG